MPRAAHVHPRDVAGFARLAAHATGGVTDIVEAMHRRIAPAPALPFLAAPDDPTRTGGVAGFVYSSIRAVAGAVGASIDTVTTPLLPMLGERLSTPRRDAVLSALNGVVGDHLAADANPLALRMEFRREGRALPLERAALAEAIPNAGPRIVLMVHGLCMCDLQWNREGHDHGRALERDLGYTPVYLRYNTGLHISVNGRRLGALLDELIAAWPVPVEEVAVVGHSMGGLVSRSACAYAKYERRTWPRFVRRMVFLGSPHHGAPLEQGGSWLHEVLGFVPFVEPLSRLGNVRSAGITDLRHGNLMDEDWEGCDRFERAGDKRRPVPLPDGIDCHAIAATTGERKGDPFDRLLGDGLVPVASALGRHRDPRRRLGFGPQREWVAYGMHHMDLLSRPEVYRRIANWLAA